MSSPGNDSDPILTIRALITHARSFQSMGLKKESWDEINRDLVVGMQESSKWTLARKEDCHDSLQET
eukprot:616878-Ditylum_brightwellii.AAC.1